jgi:hypothetical protein
VLSCIECNDVLFIGEVVGCTPGDGDQWEIDVKGRTDIDAGTLALEIRTQCRGSLARRRSASELQMRSAFPIINPAQDRERQVSFRDLQLNTEAFYGHLLIGVLAK